MSTLETNSIGKYSGNNVSIDDALNLKSYTTTQRDALTSVAGDTIYNTTDSKVQVYTGSAWEDLGGVDAFSMEYLIIAGGGGGNAGYAASNGGAGGGAGGYITNYASESTGGGGTAGGPLYVSKSTALQVSIGAGGAGSTTSLDKGIYGNNSYFDFVFALGGGATGNSGSPHPDKRGGSGAGGLFGENRTAGTESSYDNRKAGDGTTNQGYRGGYGGYGGNINTGPSAGGGGAGSVGGNASMGSPYDGGDGGTGLSSSITGTSVSRAGGGGGGVRTDTSPYSGGTAGTASDGGGAGGGGGSNGAYANGSNGTANKGGGGGGASGIYTTYTGGSGGSGIIILRYATADVASYSQTGLTISSSTDGDDTILQITAGTGTITFS
jgi:hypothetical protein